MDEYDEFLETIEKAERVPEPFTGIDNRLDFLGPRIVDTQKRVTKLEYAMTQLDLPEGIMPVRKIQIPFVYTVPSGRKARMTEYAPFAGYIKEVKITWPDGCDSLGLSETLVDVRVGHGGKQIIPYPIEGAGWLALNDTTEVYPLNEQVADNDQIWVEMGNGDESNPHKITVTVTLEGTTA